jgi:hypothetical protein
MKETPQEKKIRRNLQKGSFSLEGFLGTDHRHLNEIIEIDRRTLQGYDLNPEDIADRLEYFTEIAFEKYIGPTIIDGKFEVQYDTVRGKMVCPFGHLGAYRKGLITLKNLENDIIINWTPLNIHMIRAHCFFEGIGSVHRLDPVVLIKAIF